MIYIKILIVVSLVVFQSCSECHNLTGKGKVEVIDLHFRQYVHEDTLFLKPFWYLTERIWRKDSSIIEQVRYIKVDRTIKTSITTFPVLLYRYTDLRTDSRYEFWSFSDTATLKRKFKHEDSILATGGWGIYNMKDQLRNGTIKYLPDTSIGGQKYIHAHIQRTSDSIKYHIDAWLLPKKRETYFSLDTGIYHKTGRPMVGYHIYPEGKIGLNIMQGVIFIADTLTEFEERMFTKWEQYAKEHPVK